MPPGEGYSRKRLERHYGDRAENTWRGGGRCKLCRGKGEPEKGNSLRSVRPREDDSGMHRASRGSPSKLGKEEATKRGPPL